MSSRTQHANTNRKAVRHSGRSEPTPHDGRHRTSPKPPTRPITLIATESRTGRPCLW